MQLCTCREHVECREPGWSMKGFMQSVRSAFVRVYIYGRVLLISSQLLSWGPRKARAIYIYMFHNSL